MVAFPAGLRGKPGIAERIVTPWLSAEQTRLPLNFPYVLDAQQLSTAWQQAAEVVWPYLIQGNVVFACEGDVSFYGTFTYLAQCLQQQHPGVRVEAIAGVSSPMAAAAALGIPLTCQAEKLAILPALYSFDKERFDKERFDKERFDKERFDKERFDKNDSDSGVCQLEAALNLAEVVVLMKVGSVYAQVWKILERRHLLARAYVVENATRPNQKSI